MWSLYCPDTLSVSPLTLSLCLCVRHGETIVSDAYMNAHMAAVSLPLQTCTTPMMMMSPSASSLPAVNMSCTLVAHLTLEQFTHVSSTNKREAHSYKSRTALIQPILQAQLQAVADLSANSQQLTAQQISFSVTNSWKLCYLGCFFYLIWICKPLCNPTPPQLRLIKTFQRI